LILLIIYRKIGTPITCKEFFSNNLDTFKAVDCGYKRQSSGLIKMFKKDHMTTRISLQLDPPVTSGE
jgi:hypothetical protein